MNDNDTPFSDFTDIISSEDEFRKIMGQPFAPTLDKVLSFIDDICANFIAHSPFVLIATSDGAGNLDISPRGDPVGFVQILDKKHLAIPDRPGNKRADTFLKLLKSPRVALLFLVPGIGETLRVYGEARIVRDLPLREKMAVNGRVPEFATVIHVEHAMYHCPKCTMRAGLWESEKWPDTEGVVHIGKAMVEHAHLHISEEALEDEATRAGMLNLY